MEIQLDTGEKPKSAASYKNNAAVRKRVLELIKKKGPTKNSDNAKRLCNRAVHESSTSNKPSNDSLSSNEDNKTKGGKALTAHCSLCGLSYSSFSLLQSHFRRVHLKEKNFKCKFCDFKTFLKSEVELHELRIHSKERPVQCSFCAYTTTDIYSLDSHLITHKKEKSFKCQQCPYTCGWKLQLARHAQAHFAPERQTCQVCGVVSKNKKQDLVHFSMYHADLKAKNKTEQAMHHSHNKSNRQQQQTPIAVKATTQDSTPNQKLRFCSSADKKPMFSSQLRTLLLSSVKDLKVREKMGASNDMMSVKIENDSVKTEASEVGPVQSEMVSDLGLSDSLLQCDFSDNSNSENSVWNANLLSSALNVSNGCDILELALNQSHIFTSTTRNHNFVNQKVPCSISESEFSESVHESSESQPSEVFDLATAEQGISLDDVSSHIQMLNASELMRQRKMSMVSPPPMYTTNVATPPDEPLPTKGDFDINLPSVSDGSLPTKQEIPVDGLLIEKINTAAVVSSPAPIPVSQSIGFVCGNSDEGVSSPRVNPDVAIPPETTTQFSGVCVRSEEACAEEVLAKDICKSEALLEGNGKSRRLSHQLFEAIQSKLSSMNVRISVCADGGDVGIAEEPLKQTPTCTTTNTTANILDTAYLKTEPQGNFENNNNNKDKAVIQMAEDNASAISNDDDFEKVLESLDRELHEYIARAERALQSQGSTDCGEEEEEEGSTESQKSVVVVNAADMKEIISLIESKVKESGFDAIDYGVSVCENSQASVELSTSPMSNQPLEVAVNHGASLPTASYAPVEDIVYEAHEPLHDSGPTVCESPDSAIGSQDILFDTTPLLPCSRADMVVNDEIFYRRSPVVENLMIVDPQKRVLGQLLQSNSDHNHDHHTQNRQAVYQTKTTLNNNTNAMSWPRQQNTQPQTLILQPLTQQHMQALSLAAPQPVDNQAVSQNTVSILKTDFRSAARSRFSPVAVAARPSWPSNRPINGITVTSKLCNQYAPPSSGISVVSRPSYPNSPSPASYSSASLSSYPPTPSPNGVQVVPASLACPPQSPSPTMLDLGSAVMAEMYKEAMLEQKPVMNVELAVLDQILRTLLHTGDAPGAESPQGRISMCSSELAKLLTINMPSNMPTK